MESDGQGGGSNSATVLTSLMGKREKLQEELRSIEKQCLKFKTDQAQDARKMEKLNIFFTLISRGPDADVAEVTGKEQADAQQEKKGRGRKQ